MKTTSMRQMVASKLDPVEDFKRALRHAAHLYTHTPGANRDHAADYTHTPSANRDRAADALYRAARALVAAELIQASKP